MSHRKGIRTLRYECGCVYSYRMGRGELVQVRSTWCTYHATDIWRRFPGGAGAMSRRIWRTWKNRVRRTALRAMMGEDHLAQIMTEKGALAEQTMKPRPTAKERPKR